MEGELSRRAALLRLSVLKASQIFDTVWNRPLPD